MTTAQLLASAVAGLGLGLGLIVAIGAQNAFVLRQGIRHEHVLPVVLVCIAADAVLIVAGVAGAGALFTAVPSLVDLARWGGALFLLGYAVLAARRARRRPDPDGSGLGADPDADLAAGWDEAVAQAPGRVVASGSPGTTRTAVAPTTTRTAPRAPRARLAVVGTALALTWLNPHVYLDTFVLLGSVGSTHGSARWAFAAGAMIASALWFSALGLAARALAPVFARPLAWRVLDGGIALVMTAIAFGLVAGG